MDVFAVGFFNVPAESFLIRCTFKGPILYKVHFTNVYNNIAVVSVSLLSLDSPAKSKVQPLLQLLAPLLRKSVRKTLTALETSPL